MRRSDECILTTHTGSLPRLEPLASLLVHSHLDDPGFDAAAEDAVRWAVRKQLDCGIDVVDDEKQAKPGFATLARARPPVHPSVTWAKLSALAEGARLASAQLWG